MSKCETSRWQSVFVTRADRVRPWLSRRVGVCRQRGDQGVKDITEETKHRWSLRIVLCEINAEANDGILVWSWVGYERFRFIDSSRATLTFAYKENASPCQWLFRHRSDVHALWAGAFEACAWQISTRTPREAQTVVLTNRYTVSAS